MSCKYVTFYVFPHNATLYHCGQYELHPVVNSPSNFYIYSYRNYLQLAFLIIIVCTSMNEVQSLKNTVFKCNKVLKILLFMLEIFK